MNEFLEIAGEEGLLYSQFVRHFAMRERIADISKLKVKAIGEIELPRNSLFHYLPRIPGEIGPESNTPFLNTYTSRINLHFYWEYARVLESSGIKIKPIQQTQIEMSYFKSHFNYHRAKALDSFLFKEKELLVNNVAASMVNVVYLRRTVFTPFYKYYNETSTLINAINMISEKSDRYQFFELPLPNRFPSYQELKFAYSYYKRFFKEDGSLNKPSKEALKLFHAERSYWLLDLYALLLGFDDSKNSIFNKLSEKSKELTSFIFTYNGSCVIVNIKTLLNLMSFSDKEDDTEASGIRINYFKRFYLNLISMVVGTDLSILNIEEKESNGESKEGNREEKRERDIQRDKPLGSDSGSGDLVDILPDNKEGDSESIPESRTEGNKEPVETTETYIEDGSDEEVETIAWGDDIPDEVFEQVIVQQKDVVKKSKPYTPTRVIEAQLESKAREGRLTNKEKDYFLSISNKYKEIDIDGRNVADIIDIKPEEMVLDDIKLSKDSPTVVDKSILRSRTDTLSKGYISKLHQRNIIKMLTYVQNGGICLTNLEKEDTITADSKFTNWTLETHPIDGTKGKTGFRIPKVKKDGTFLIDDVKYYAQLQRMENPVRKVGPTAVQLTSYYDKPRIRIERSTLRVNDYAHWLKNEIIGSAVKNKDIKITLGSFNVESKSVNPYYSILSSRFKEIEVNGLHLNFNTNELLDKKEDLKECNFDSWIIGKKDNEYILIDNNGLISIKNGETIGYIEDLFNLNYRKSPLPLATVNINGYKFPIVVVLSYWMGFSNLLKAIGADYRVIEPNKRPELEPSEYVINFSDCKLIFNKRDELTTLIVSGLLKINSIVNFGLSNLDDPSLWFNLINDPKVKPTHFKEMDQINEMFIDPITKELLEEYKYPTYMPDLCIECVKMLLNYQSKPETDITEQRFVGYERFAGHVYRELCRAVRQYRNRPPGSKKTFSINPEAIMLNIITDSSVQAVEEVNPIHQLKQQSEVTFGGTMGRAQEAMVRRTRGLYENEIGIISEAGKDSSKVGFVSYLTCDAKLVDYYGRVNVKEKPTKSGLGSITLNTLYGGTKDDSKRLKLIITYLLSKGPYIRKLMYALIPNCWDDLNEACTKAERETLNVNVKKHC